MNNILRFCLLALLCLQGLASAYAGHVLTINVVDACTSQPVPDGGWVKFVTGAPGMQGNAYLCVATEGVAYYDPELSGLQGCGHIEAANGAVLSSISPDMFCESCELTNYWCGEVDNSITVYVSFPIAARFNVNGAIQNVPQPTVIKEFTPVNALTMNNTVSGMVNSYEVRIAKGVFDNSSLLASLSSVSSQAQVSVAAQMSNGASQMSGIANNVASGFFSAAGRPLSSGVIPASSVPGSIDLLTIAPDLATYTGVVAVSLIVNECTEVTQYFDLQPTESQSLVNFTLNGIGGDPYGPPSAMPLHPCDGSIIFFVDPYVLESESVAFYSVKVEEGTVLQNGFVASGPSWFQQVQGSSIPKLDLNTFFGTPILTGYTGHIRVTLSAYDLSGPIGSYSLLFDISTATTISAIDFALNGITQPTITSTPPAIWLCDGGATLMFTGTETGTLGYYEINIEQGSWAGTTFTPSGISVTNAYWATTIATYDLNTWPIVSGYTGYIRVNFTAFGPCCSGIRRTQIFYVGHASSITAVDFTLNGATQTTPTSAPPLLWLCDAATMVLNGTETGDMTNYSIKVEQGAWAGTVFTPSAVPPVTNLYTGTTISSANISGFTGMSGYSGNVRITLTATGPCNALSSVQVFDVQHSTSITAADFNLNGFTQTTPVSTPPVIWVCNGNPLTFTGTETGDMNVYTIKVEQGVWSGSAFAASGTPAINSYAASSIATADINTFTGMATYSGIVQVTLTVSGPCTYGFSKVQVFDMEHSSAAVFFEMNANGCSGITSLPRQTTLPIPDAVFTATPCTVGWQGVLSAGIRNILYPVGVTSYQIKVNEVDPLSGAFMTNIFVQTATGPVPSWNFSTACPGYIGDFFYSNLTPLSTSNRTFKVVVTANTASCTDSSFSYFRIAGPGYWRGADGNGPIAGGYVSELRVYPNPADRDVNFEWNSDVKQASPAELMILDIYGRTIIDQHVSEEVNFNKLTVHTADLPAGIYMYKLSIDGGLRTGKFQKD